MTLPIQKLPILVIHLILQTMGFQDMFLLTRISTKMKRIVQRMGRIPKHCLYVTIGRTIMIQIQTMTYDRYPDLMNVVARKNDPPGWFSPFNMKIGSVACLPSAFCKYSDGQNVVETCWNDIKVGCDELCNEIIELFNTPVRSVTLKLYRRTNYQNEINWTNSTFPNLVIFELIGHCNFQDYMWMIKNAKATEELHFGMEPSGYPVNKNSLVVIPLELKHIEIEHGKWVSLRQLEAIKSNYIMVKEADLTDSEINEFLMNLKNSKEKPKFKELYILFDRQSDTTVVFEGLQDEDVLEPNIGLQELVFKTGNGQKCAVTYNLFEFERPAIDLLGYEVLIED
ncbi:hypothetical protein CAEBREN_05988 [Caenorhabditis brenneri]|uniref:F-box domain-containing protein n=1 Tax=Caenorhabditis brenneri TaxID=135651 RepID=G0MAH7_CAEBE|nr:hypothetical protein CAEBREN_05988 [Caenorhabditis brenneri]